MMMLCGVGGNPTDCGVSVSKKEFAPRAGLAYRLTNSFVIRAGYGITNEPYNLADDLRTNYPVLIPLFFGASGLQAAGVLDTASLQNAPPQSKGAKPLPVGIPLPPIPDLNAAELPMPNNVGLASTGSFAPRGYIQSWNLTAEKQLGQRWAAQAGYVATRTIRQIGFLDLNVGDPTVCFTSSGAASCGGKASRPFNLLFGRTAATSLITPIANNHYDALQSQLIRRFAGGYQVQIGYTWSKAMGVANVSNEKNNPYIQIPEFLYLNRGPAPFDRRHNFEAAFIAEPPFGPSKRWANSGAAAAILGGWQLSGIVTAVSGSVVSVSTTSGTSASNLNAPGNSQRPDLLHPVTITGVVGPQTTWFDTSAFGIVPDQRFGTSPFYPMYGPGIFNMDLGLTRTFKLTERTNFEFRAQAINSTNTPHFSNPTGDINSSNFGQIRSTTNLGRDGIDQRQFMLSARLSF
jgi:hypothetical protein